LRIADLKMLRALITRRQFSLATLLGVVTLVAIFAAAYGLRHRAVLAEVQALRLISAKGGHVKDYGSEVYVAFTSSANEPSMIALLCAADRTYLPSSSAGEFTDDDLALFNNLRRPFRVYLSNTRVSRAAAEQFRAKHPHCHVEY
jgi:hypothetical protein